jgi:hypothetical protein
MADNSYAIKGRIGFAGGGAEIVWRYFCATDWLRGLDSAQFCLIGPNISARDLSLSMSYLMHLNSKNHGNQ